jgi:hypothetical protein
LYELYPVLFTWVVKQLFTRRRKQIFNLNNSQSIMIKITKQIKYLLSYFLSSSLKPISRIVEKYLSRSEEKDPRDEHQANVPVEHHLCKCIFFPFKLTSWLSWKLAWTLCHWKPLQCFIFNFLDSVTRTWWTGRAIESGMILLTFNIKLWNVVWQQIFENYVNSMIVTFFCRM